MACDTDLNINTAKHNGHLDLERQKYGCDSKLLVLSKIVFPYESICHIASY